MPQDQDNFQVTPPEPVATGLANLAPIEPIAPNAPALPTAEEIAAAALAQLPPGDDRRPDAPVANTNLTAAEIRAAEINEGARQNKLHEHLPQPVHPAVEAGVHADLEASEPVVAQILPRPKGETIEQRIRRQDAQARLESEARKGEFVRKVMAARHPEPQPERPQPVAPQIMDQTKREMAEGARQNARHAEFHSRNPMPPHPDPTNNTSSTPVFRPADYVPNMKQGLDAKPFS